MIRQQVLYGREHNIDLHFVDGVTECNIMLLTEMCLCRKYEFTSQFPYGYKNSGRQLKKKPQKPLQQLFLKTSSLFLQEDQQCKTADAVLIPLTDHLNVILHPVCITADNCPLKSATIEVTMSY